MKLRTTLSVAAIAAATASTAYAVVESRYVDSHTIREVQQTLKDRGFRAAVDGIMGPRTQAAVRQFQRSENLEPTGQLNRQTLIALGIQRPDNAARSDEPQYSSQTVRLVQRTLNNRGFRAGAIDGVMSPATRAAMKEFQKSENLEETGRLNPQTLAALGISPDSMAPVDEHAMRSDATVREVQRRLNSLGYRAGPSDGILGHATRSALMSFQRSENLEVTGQLNRETLSALRVGEPLASR